MPRTRRTEVIIAIITLLTWIGVGTVLFHTLEPWTWIEAFYFSVVSITTVGYGDLMPSNDITRLVTALYILTGVGIGISSLSII